MSQTGPPSVPSWALSLLPSSKPNSTASTPAPLNAAANANANGGKQLPALAPTRSSTSTPASAPGSAAAAPNWTPTPASRVPYPNANGHAANARNLGSSSRAVADATAITAVWAAPNDPPASFSPQTINPSQLNRSQPQPHRNEASSAQASHKATRSAFSASSRIRALQKDWSQQQNQSQQWSPRQGDSRSTSEDISAIVKTPSELSIAEPKTTARDSSNQPVLRALSISSSSSEGSDIPSVIPMPAFQPKPRQSPNVTAAAVLNSSLSPHRKRTYGDADFDAPDQKRRQTESLPLSTQQQAVARPTFIPISRSLAPMPPSSSEDEYEDEDEESDSDVGGAGATRSDVEELYRSGHRNAKFPSSSQPFPSLIRPEVILPGKRPPGEAFHPLLTTVLGDRPYTSWRDSEGNYESGAGAILPTGYKPLTDDPRFANDPWVCPVRDCRNLFPKLKIMGNHMSGKHYSTAFNDNRDGTLSFVSTYRRVAGSQRAGPIVISQNIPGPDAAPAKVPQLSARALWLKARAAKMEQKPSPELRSRRPGPSMPVGNTDSPAVTDSTTPTSQNVLMDPSFTEEVHDRIARHQRLMRPEWNRELVSYMMDRLGPEMHINPKRTFCELWKQPRVRDLPRDSVGHRRVAAWNPPAISAIALYLTGEVRTDRPCYCCKTGNSTWKECVTAGTGTSRDLQGVIKGTCASCWFKATANRQKNTCSFLDDDDGSPHADDDADLDPEPDTPMDQVLSEPEAEEQPYRNLRQTQARLKVAEETSPEPAGVEDVHVFSPARPVKEMAVAANPSPGPIIHAGQTMSADLLEMEDWEVAPGRIRREDGPAPDNIAFSNSYLTSNSAIPVSNNVRFNVVVLKPGGSTLFPAEHGKLRVCSLATGKVRVKMDRDDEFVIGPNGMFKVRVGEMCSVQNRLYIDAVLHVSTITEK